MVDATGKFLKKESMKFETGNNEQTISLDGFAKGIYFLRIISDEGYVQGIKVVKE
jgi:hypothetical protein